MHAPEGVERALRLRAAAIAGYERDQQRALALLDDMDPGVRTTALGALVRMGKAGSDHVARAMCDSSASARRHIAELALPLDMANYLPLLADTDASVVEAACFAVGEARDRRAVEDLCRIASGHFDPLCRESAVAALGAIGDPAGLPCIMRGLQDRPAVRRRAVIALAPFDGPEVLSALEQALQDRDWQVRQAAEDLLRS
ncbi:MAG: HEAT repeat domain-containing protein [Actinomycetota bacterium]|nr:HEAT repeat domain-containing protein [Actinomycetota bacterium]